MTEPRIERVESITDDLSHALNHWATARPELEALVSEGRRWIWSKLRNDVQRLSGALAAEGLRPGSRFAHIDRNHSASVMSTLAAAHGGFVHVAVNWRLGGDELAYVLAHSESEVVLVGDEFWERVVELRGGLPHLRRIVRVGGTDDDYRGWLESSAPGPHHETASGDAGVLQLYTSGTTGRPKGAILTHRSLGDNALGQAEEQGLDARSTHAVPMPMFHIGGQSMLVSCLVTGSRLILTPNANEKDLVELIGREQVTHLFLVPTAFQRLISEPTASGQSLGSLRCLLYSGSPMSRDLVLRALEMFDGMLAVHGGGGTG